MRIQYVNVHLVDRCYGGPEEGGWYYDSGEILKSIPVLPEKRARLYERVARWCENENREQGLTHRSSVIGGPNFEASWTDEPGESFPDERPRYE